MHCDLHVIIKYLTQEIFCQAADVVHNAGLPKKHVIVLTCRKRDCHFGSSGCLFCFLPPLVLGFAGLDFRVATNIPNISNNNEFGQRN